MASKVESKSTHICSSLRNKRKRKLSKKNFNFFFSFLLGKASLFRCEPYKLPPVIKSHTVKLSLFEPTDQLWLLDV